MTAPVNRVATVLAKFGCVACGAVADDRGVNRFPALGQFAGSPPVSFTPGAVIFKEGDKGDMMYVVCAGEVDIDRGDKVIETLAPGGVFGEMALIDGSPISGTARAKTDCELAPITEKSFFFFALSLMCTLVEPLRRMNELS